MYNQVNTRGGVFGPQDAYGGGIFFGLMGLGTAPAGASCWDRIKECDPPAADQLRGQILQLQNAVAQAKAAVAAGDPNAALAVQQLQAQLNSAQYLCNERGNGCQSLVKNLHDKFEEYGCDATQGPFCEGLQNMVNEKLPTTQQIQVTGVWDKPTCAAWWKVFGRNPTMNDVRDSLDPTIRQMFGQAGACGAPNNFKVLLPHCADPNYHPGVDVTVPDIPKCSDGGTYDPVSKKCVPSKGVSTKSGGVSTAWVVGGLIAAGVVAAGYEAFKHKKR